MRVLVVAAALVVGGCSTTKNPSFCCLTEADCQAAGVGELRPCTEGLACKENTCVPASCAMEGCAAAAPVCETATDTCLGCTDSSECARFPATAVCDVDGAGSCVECVGSLDCPSSEPICDAYECRTCVSDGECSTGACNDDGTCVEENQIVYLTPSGSDQGDCSRAAPCQDLVYGLTRASASRAHIVFANGSFTTSGAKTQAPLQRITIHGHGATLTGGNADYATIETTIPTTIRDLRVTNPIAFGTAVFARGARLEKVGVTGYTGVSVDGQVMAFDLDVSSTGNGIFVAGNLVLERARIRGGNAGIAGYGTLDVTNALISDTNIAGVNFDGARGTLRFTTIGRTNLLASNGLGARCTPTSQIRFESSIIWDSTETAGPNVDGCNDFASSIVGPMMVTGASNTPPLFADEQGGNLHITMESPARDAADSGPTTDFEGDTRPRGTRFDLGADEAP